MDINSNMNRKCISNARLHDCGVKQGFDVASMKSADS